MSRVTTILVLAAITGSTGCGKNKTATGPLQDGVGKGRGQNSGPGGGVGQALAASGTTVFAASARAGVFRSTNNGASWTSVNSGLTDLTVLALAFGGTSVFAGTNSGGVFRSTNDGASWTAVDNGLANPRARPVEALALESTGLV